MVLSEILNIHTGSRMISGTQVNRKILFSFGGVYCGEVLAVCAARGLPRFLTYWNKYVIYLVALILLITMF